MQVLATGIQNRTKSCYAAGPNVDLTLRCNGEEITQVIDAQGNIISAGLPPPSVAPTVTNNSTTYTDPSLAPPAGTTYTYLCYYSYVYAATQNYPLVQSYLGAAGDLSPRSNPSPISPIPAVFTFVSTTTTVPVYKINVPISPRFDITEIWIYRTLYFETTVNTFGAQEALTAAQAGEMYFVGSVANVQTGTTVSYLDSTLQAALIGNGQIEFDNLLAPTALFCTFAFPYFYLFGNDPLPMAGTLDAFGVFAITDNTLIYNGRDGQFVKFNGITSGGFDGLGSFIIKTINQSSFQLYADSGFVTKVNALFTGTTTATVYSFSGVLWRSKANNPLAWGETVLVGSAAIPELWKLNIGGRGTGLFATPSASLLLIHTESPTKCWTLNLRQAQFDTFRSTLRSISDDYSCSINGSMFASTLKDGTNQIWALDLKAHAIIQSDGSQNIPISEPVKQTLRTLSLIPSDEIRFMGVYDKYTQLNCIWVKFLYHNGHNNLLIFQHAPSGEWGMSWEHDMTAVGTFTNPYTRELVVLGGTSIGDLGRIFQPGGGPVVNWWSTSFPATSALSTTVLNWNTSGGFVNFNTNSTLDSSALNRWVVVEYPSPDGGSYFYGQITAIASNVVQINQASISAPQLFEFFTIAGSGGAIGNIYVCEIEVILSKYFDLQSASALKRLDEIWFNIEGVSTDALEKFGLGLVKDLGTTATATLVKPTSLNNQDYMVEGNKVLIPRTRCFGLIIIERGYSNCILQNYTPIFVD